MEKSAEEASAVESEAHNPGGVLYHDEAVQVGSRVFSRVSFPLCERVGFARDVLWSWCARMSERKRVCDFLYAVHGVRAYSSV